MKGSSGGKKRNKSHLFSCTLFESKLRTIVTLLLLLLLLLRSLMELAIEERKSNKIELNPNYS